MKMRNSMKISREIIWEINLINNNKIKKMDTIFIIKRRVFIQRIQMKKKGKIIFKRNYKMKMNWKKIY